MSDQYLPTYIDKVDNSISIMNNENAISYYKNNGDINTISAKNIAHKKLDDNLNLCAFDGSNFNSVISINNSNSNCEINNILKISNHILPTNNASYDIGSAEYKIRHLFLSDNSLWIGNEHKIDISDGKMKLKKIKKSDTFIPSGLTDNADLQAAITNRGGTRANYTINDWNIIAEEVGVSNFNEVFQSDNSDNWEEDVEMGGGGGGGESIDYNTLINKPTIPAVTWTTSGSDVYRSSGNVGIGVVNPTKNLEVNGDIECNTLYGLQSNNGYIGPYDTNYGWGLPPSSGYGDSISVWYRSWNTIAGHYSSHNQYIRHFIKNIHDTYSSNNLATRIGWEAYDNNSYSGTLSDDPGSLPQQAYIVLRPRNGPTEGILSFTGQHRNVPNNIDLYNNINNYIGYIVCSTGNYKTYNYDKKILEEKKNAITINDALPVIELSNKKQQKTVFGVISDKEEEDRKLSVGAFCTPYPNINDDKRLYINSIGEGGIWIVNTNGDLENGDYIQSSSVIGLGEKQEDDILHSYTVAKITCDCNFELNTDNYECIEFIDPTSGNTYKKAFVGCTYHCG